MKPSTQPTPAPMPPNTAPKPLSIQVVQRTAAVIVQMSGAASVTELETLRRTVDELLPKPPRRVIVDLCGLEFIASLGLGQLVRLAVAVRNKGGLFRVCGAHAGITQAIIKSKLNELMPVFRDVAEAER